MCHEEIHLHHRNFSPDQFCFVLSLSFISLICPPLMFTRETPMTLPGSFSYFSCQSMQVTNWPAGRWGGERRRGEED